MYICALTPPEVLLGGEIDKLGLTRRIRIAQHPHRRAEPIDSELHIRLQLIVWSTAFCDSGAGLAFLPTSSL